MTQKKLAVITGGANGIGRCIAETFLQNGYRTAVLDVDQKEGERLAGLYGEDYFFFPGDAAEKDVLEAFAGEISRRYPAVDALINNACVSRGGLSSCGYEDFLYVLRLGTAAPYYLTRLLLDKLVPGASIVNISSTRAAMSQPDTESYSAAKGGISALTHALSASLAGKARVNSISPGWIDTGAFHGEGEYTPVYSKGDTAQHPAGRVGNPHDIAEMALFLCSDKAGFITGENITIDGGMTRLMIYHDDCGWTYHPPV